MIAPVLTILSTTEPFVVYCDASKMDLGGGLCIETNYEKNYPMHFLELVVVVFALKIWRHYLFVSRFKMSSYHKSLKYLFNHN